MLVVAAVLGLHDPHIPGSYGLCPIRAVTGRFCPGCGALRAIHDLLHLDFSGAMAMNPLMVFAVPVLVALWVWWLWRTWQGRPVTTMSVGGAALLGVVLVGFAVARNIPTLMPWLAP